MSLKKQRIDIDFFIVPFITENYRSVIMAVSYDAPNSLIHSPCCLLAVPLLSSQNLQIFTKYHNQWLTVELIENNFTSKTWVTGVFACDIDCVIYVLHEIYKKKKKKTHQHPNSKYM